MGLVFLVVTIILIAGIPKLRRSTPAEFPGCDPDVHARWKAKALMGTYVFLGTVVGGTGAIALVFLLMAPKPGKESEEASMVAVILLISCLCGIMAALIWAAILSRQAHALRRQLRNDLLPPSYYPRPGQPLILSPPPSQPPPTADPEGSWSNPPDPPAAP